MRLSGWPARVWTGLLGLWAHVPWGPSTDAAGDWICASVLMPHEGRVTCLLFLPDKCTLASGDSRPMERAAAAWVSNEAALRLWY